MREQAAITIEARYEPWDRWFENRIYPSPDGVAIFFTEITEQRRAEREAERRRARLVEAQRVAHVGSWEWDVGRQPRRLVRGDLSASTASRSAPRSADYEEFLSRVHPDDLEQTKATIAAPRSSRDPFVYDHRIVRTDGSVRMLHTRGEAIAVERRKLTRLVGMLLGHDRTLAAAQAQEREAGVVQALLDGISEGVLVVNDDAKVRQANAALASLFALRPDLVWRGASAVALFDEVARTLVNGAAFVERFGADGLRSVTDGTDIFELAAGGAVTCESRGYRVGDRVVARLWIFRSGS